MMSQWELTVVQYSAWIHSFLRVFENWLIKCCFCFQDGPSEDKMRLPNFIILSSLQ